MNRRAGITLTKTEIAVPGEAALRADPRFRAIFQSNVLPLVFWHRDGRVRDANEAYLQLTGYSRQEIGEGTLRCNRLTAPEHLVRDEHAIEELSLGRIICTPFEKDYIRRDGQRKPVLLAAALLPNYQDEGIALAMDLTRYSSAENALHTHKELIHDLFAAVLGKVRVPAVDKLMRLKSDTPSLEPGALLAHELSQPLGTILANAQSARRLLRQSAPDVEQLKAIVSDIIAEDRRAARLIDQVRLSLRHRKISLHALNVNQVIGEALRMLHNQFSGYGVKLELALTAELPPIRGDRLQLHQLFTNLFSNACQAMSRTGRAAKRLLIRTTLEGESLVAIDVEDTGPGIRPEELDEIFDAFVSNKRKGMGVGLYICRSVVLAHGGRLWATNNAEGGATFHVRLPAAIAA
jgi:PAS domain S-box-containing protein